MHLQKKCGKFLSFFTVFDYWLYSMNPILPKIELNFPDSNSDAGLGLLDAI